MTIVATASEFVWLIQESSYGTPVASPVAGTSMFLVPLVDANSFTMVEDPIYQEIKYGGGLDVVADVVSDHHEVKGQLTTLGYPALSAFLHDAACTRVNSGQTLPWVTTEPQYDLASMYIYHMIRRRDGTWVTLGYPGCKITELSASVSRQDPKLKLTISLQGQKELPNAKDSSAAPTAPANPTEAQYPRGPYLMSHTTGLVSWSGTPLTQYDELSYKITNKFDPRWWEAPWLSSLGCKGREATADVGLLLKATPALRTAYLALTSGALSVGFSNGTHTLATSFNSNAHINKLPFDLPLGKEFRQKATFRNKWDATANTGAGDDVTVTAT